MRYLNLWFLKVWLAPGILTFRLFGKGLNIKNVKLQSLLFSQRGITSATTNSRLG